MNQDTIVLFGFVLRQIDLEAIKILVTILIGGGLLGVAWRHLKMRWDERGNRQLDHYLDTVTHASEPDADGYRVCSIENKGMTERLETVVRDRRARKWMLSAAKHCDWKRRFIKDKHSKRQERILHVVRNAMTRHFVPGSNAFGAKQPVVETDYFYAVTAAEIAEVADTKANVRMIRTMWATEDTLRIFDTHPVDKWRFEVDKATGIEQDHQVRVQTMREMAEALFRNKGCRTMNGSSVRIIGWMRGRVPA